MAQQEKVTTEESVDKAWSRIGNSDWDQMAWFVKLANTGDFISMSAGELLLWQEEFMAMFLRGHAPVMQVPLESKRYPRSDGPSGTLLEWPTPTEMLEVRDVIKRPIDDLADGRATWIPGNGSFDVNYSVKFMGNPEYFNERDTEPRYFIFHNEVSSSRSYPEAFSLRLLRLLQAYPDMNRRHICADKLRRCPHCLMVFLQVKRSSRYCGPKCYTVDGMRRLRKQQKEQLMRKKGSKTPVRRSTRKVATRRGKANL